MMMLMLSQIDSVPAGISSWLGNLSFIVMLVIGVVKLGDRFVGRKEALEISPQPLEVKLAAAFVRLEEFHQAGLRVAAIESQMAELRAERIKDAKDGAASRSKIHAEIKEGKDLMMERLDEMRREVAQETKDVRKELSDKIDGLPERVITILKNTGALE